MSPLDFVRVTMIVATVLWAVGEALMRRSERLDRVARVSFSAGLALALIHAAAAFDVVYAWDHERAVRATAQQAADVFGWRGGIYVNYVLLAVWLGDVAWWWLAPASRSARPRPLERLRLAFFAFMFLNGAVIFASGVGRAVGVASLGLVGAAWLVPRSDAKPVLRRETRS